MDMWQGFKFCQKGFRQKRHSKSSGGQLPNGMRRRKPMTEQASARYLKWTSKNRKVKSMAINPNLIISQYFKIEVFD